MCSSSSRFSSFQRSPIEFRFPLARVAVCRFKALFFRRLQREREPFSGETFRSRLAPESERTAAYRLLELPSKGLRKQSDDICFRRVMKFRRLLAEELERAFKECFIDCRSDLTFDLVIGII